MQKDPLQTKQCALMRSALAASQRLFELRLLPVDDAF
jgi:hypothetical protein